MAVLVFTFLGCSSDDSDIDLLNECPEGYMGTNCDIKKTPSKIKITKIVLKSYPLFKPNGSNWDGWLDNTESEPDVLIIFGKNGNLLYTSNVYYDAIGQDLTFNISPPIEITNVFSSCTIGILDYDNNNLSESEIMGGGDFFIYDTNDEGFPAVFNITDLDQLVSVDFHLTYEFF